MASANRLIPTSFALAPYNPIRVGSPARFRALNTHVTYKFGLWNDTHKGLLNVRLCTSLRMNAITVAKRAAAHRAIEEHLKPDLTAVGIGSGSTVVFCVERIQQLVAEQKLSTKNMVFVPTGFQSKNLILEAALPLKEIDQFDGSGIDIVFDGADEIDSQLNCIKGGGACQFQEKLVGLSAKKFIIVADDSKVSSNLGEHWVQGVPIEIVPPAMKKVTSDLKALGAIQVTLRLGGKAKAGPIVTDNGNLILDAHFGTIAPSDVSNLDKQIKLIVGVVETGLFNYGSEAYIGKSDGTFNILKR